MENLQERAERLAEQFTEKARKPLVIEFAGVPKAGKTTTLSHVQTFLKRCGFHTDVVIERASECPIRDKTAREFQYLDRMYDARSDFGKNTKSATAWRSSDSFS